MSQTIDTVEDTETKTPFQAGLVSGFAAGMTVINCYWMFHYQLTLPKNMGGGTAGKAMGVSLFILPFVGILAYWLMDLMVYIDKKLHISESLIITGALVIILLKDFFSEKQEYDENDDLDEETGW